MPTDLPGSPWLLRSFALQNQMPWSQSTSLHIYHSITYRMSKMAKINRATRIALVTGDMRDCISAASAKAAQFATVHWGAWMLYHPSRPLGFDGISCTDISREWFTNIRAKDITRDHLEKGRSIMFGEESRRSGSGVEQVDSPFQLHQMELSNGAPRKGETTEINSHWWKQV